MVHTAPFGEWLKQRRKELDFTQDELARLIDCSPATIRKIESGERKPSRQMVELLARVLEVPSTQHEAFSRLARHGEHAPHIDVPHASSTAADGASTQPAPIASPAKAPEALNNLPVYLTPLIGREEEIDSLTATLLRQDVRLLTLLGPPGIGKTRLAIEAARLVAGHFSHGVAFVALAPITDPELVAGTIAQSLGVKEASSQTVRAALLAYLSDKQLLLVLDNFEQVVAAVPLLTEILITCPGVKLLTTSREALHVRAEKQYPVPPLNLPADAALLTPGELLRYPAVQLFVDRAEAVRPDFTLNSDNAEAVATLCARLDGLPLAIELAAARSRLLTPQEIVTRLSRSLPLLTGGPRDLPSRQQTLRGAIKWSYDLLDATEQHLFARLGVFVGGCTLDAAEAICNVRGDLPPVLDSIASLVDKNLLRQESGTNGESRFTMLETIREYALERLEESGEAPAIRRYHAEFFLAIIVAADLEAKGTSQGDWLNQFEAEHDNLRAALTWAIEQGEGQFALQIVGGLWRFWYVRSHMTEGRRWLAEALFLPSSQTRNTARARALNGAGNLAYTQSDHQAALALHEQSLAISREIGDRKGIAGSLNNIALIARYRGDNDTARALLEEAIKINRDLGNRRWEAINLNNLGSILHNLGDYPAAYALQEQSLAIFTDLKDNWGMAMCYVDMGRMSNDQGDYAAARTAYEKSMELHRATRDRRGTANALSSMALESWNLGDYAPARSLYEEALALFRDLGDKRGVASALNGLGHITYCQGDYEGARHLYEESLAIREELMGRYDIAASHHNLGYIAFREGKYDEARPLLEQSICELQGVGDRWALVYAKNNLARLVLAEGDIDRARALLDEALAESREIGSKRTITYSLGGLGMVAMRTGDVDGADVFFREKLAMASSVRAKWDIARAILSLAWVARMRGDCEREAVLLAAGETMREAMGAVWESSLRKEMEASIARSRQNLGDSAFAKAWQRGASMSIEHTAAYALVPALCSASGSPVASNR